MADTGIRYPNRERAEVHVTKLDGEALQVHDNDGDDTEIYGWRCAGCQVSSPQSETTDLDEARGDAESHAEYCKALPPAASPAA